MTAILKVLTEGQFQDLAVIEEGAELVLGRSLDVEISVPDDAKMSGSHLRIQASEGKFAIEDLGSTNGTFLNSEPVAQATIAFGEVFCCGGTEFVIVEKGTENPVATISDSSSLAAVAATEAGFCVGSLDEIIDRFELQKNLPLTPEPEETPANFALRLSDLDEPNHCVTFLAYALEKRAAVWWLTRCIEEVECLLDDNDREMLRLAEAWVVEPTDAHRRQAMEHAEMMEMSTPACWAGVGAFWSSGSMAPVDSPTVEPKDNLAGKALSGGAIMASVFHAPENAFEKQKNFTQLGIDVAAGNLPWS